MAKMFSKAWADEVYRAAVEDEAAETEARLRELHVIQGVCHRHPNVRISTGGGFPAFDGLCGACENEMDEAAEYDATR